MSERPTSIPTDALGKCERDCGRDARQLWQSPDSGSSLALCATCSWKNAAGFDAQGWQQVVTLTPA